MKFLVTVVLLWFIVVSSVFAEHPSASEPHNNHPSIVLIMVDDMGYGDPKCFNPESKIELPNIEQLASEGMRFTDAHAPGPLCHMSRYGLMTGRYPFRVNVGLWPKQRLIQKDEVTIASLAKQQGYRTAMVGKWHLGFDEQGYDQPLPGGPVDCGFDSFFGIRASTDIPPYFYIRDDQAVEPPTETIEANRSEGWSPIQGAFWRQGKIAKDLKLDQVLPRFTDEAIAVIDDHAKRKQEAAEEAEPLFLYLAFPAPHTPWLPSDKFDGASQVGMYGDFAMMVDFEIGRVLNAIDRGKMKEDTLVIFTSDNGPVWYQEDADRFGHDSSGPLRGMKSDAWEGGHRMPFIARWPSSIAANASSEQLVCFTDLLATFAELWQVKLPADAGPDSFSFLPALTGDEADPSTQRTQFVMRAGSVGTMMMIRSGDWKLINQLGSGGFTKPNRVQPSEGQPNGQLYNMKTDVGETKNVYAEHPEIVRRLEQEMKAIVNESDSSKN